MGMVHTLLKRNSFAHVYHIVNKCTSYTCCREKRWYNTSLIASQLPSVKTGPIKSCIIFHNFLFSRYAYLCQPWWFFLRQSQFIIIQIIKWDAADCFQMNNFLLLKTCVWVMYNTVTRDYIQSIIVTWFVKGAFFTYKIWPIFWSLKLHNFANVFIWNIA